MKLLVLTSRFPWPIEKGDKLRLYYQLRELSARHEVVLLSLHEGELPAEARAAVAPFCSQLYVLPLRRWEIFLRVLAAGIGGGRPVQTAWFYHPRLLRQVREIAARERPDHVYCQLLRMAPYARGLGIPATLDYMDAFSLGMQRRAAESPFPLSWLFAREARLFRRQEADVFPWFASHTVISDQDRAYLPHPEALRIVPNGVDTQYFSPEPGAAPTHEVVFVGNLGYFPNIRAAVLLAEEIMPRVWATLPEARLLVAGARPAAQVRALAREARVEVRGWQPDIRTAYRAGKVFCAPLFAGSGQQNKILEAMALGLPCVTTPLVNAAIGAAPGREVHLAGDAEAFAAALVALLRAPEQRQALGAEGRRFVTATYSWEAACRPLEALWQFP